jgi:hypothetical protein
MGGLGAAKDSISDLSRQTSFRRRQDPAEGEYEPFELCEQDDDDDTPIWEMDDSHAWRTSDAENSFADDEGNVYVHSADRTRHHWSIADCERIFTVPEVFDDIMTSRKGGLVLLCHVFDTCRGRRESFKRNAFSQPAALENEDLLAENGTRDQKMKRMNLAVQLYMNMPPSKRQSFNPSLYKIRLDGWDGGTQTAAIVGDHHQIFGSHYGAITTEAYHRNIHTHRRVHFSELKRVLKVRKFTSDEASDVWYQREDFAHFKAEMTLLIRDMEASKELAAIWLDSEESERRRSMESSENLNPTPGNECKNNHKSRAWWHDYDHSRRGLERYASPGQARQILASYKVALHKVFAEQRRQTLFRCFLPCIPQNVHKNADRIAQIYHEYTAWSSDLALAAGASDADCVRSNFNDDTRKTREYYILKQVIRNGYRVHKHMPEFMMPKCITPKGFLDESETLSGTHYCDLDRTQRRRESIIERANKSIRGGSQTGKEAREEMSHLTKSDLNGPIAPALAPMLDGNGEERGNIVGNMSPQHHGKKQSLAAKAKNYPFQQ